MNSTVERSLIERRSAQHEHLLEVDDLRVEFRTRDGIVHAVNGISYAVDHGETLAILGESGSGKSVTAQAVMGILDSPPGFVTGGSVRYRGQDLLQMSDDERRTVVGLHPDRAPTIVAGVIGLVEVLRAFGLDEVEISEHDILRGAALRRISGH